MRDCGLAMISSTHDPIGLSIVMITQNESTNLPRTLASLPAGAELCVLDSGSTDDTREIARSAGGIVSQRIFTDYADQRNVSLKMASRPWILILDADEVLDYRLRDAITQIASAPLDAADCQIAYRVNRRMFFLGRELRFGGASDKCVRLFRRENVHYEGEIHERPVFTMRTQVRRINGHLCHYSYASLSEYLARMDRYTSRIRDQRLSIRRGPRRAGPLLVARVLMDFIRRYVLRGGFRDGHAGLIHAGLSSFYTFIKYSKLYEAGLVRDEHSDDTRLNLPPGGDISKIASPVPERDKVAA